MFWIRMHIEDQLDAMLDKSREKNGAAPSRHGRGFWCKMLGDAAYAAYHEKILELSGYGDHDILERILDDYYDGGILESSSVGSTVKFMHKLVPGSESRRDRLARVGLLDHILTVAAKAAKRHPHKHVKSGLVVSALLHDAGKCQGLCRIYGIDPAIGHEAAGAQYARHLMSEFPEESDFLEPIAAYLDPSLGGMSRKEAERSIFVSFVTEADRETRMEEGKEA